MGVDDQLHWFAIQAHLGAEAAAESNLRALEVETFLPLTRRTIRRGLREPRRRLRPLFLGYLFARFCPAVSLRAVKYSRGVLRVLGAGLHPWPVDDEVIANVRERVGPDGFVELSERPLEPGDCVRVTEGPLAGWSGVFDSEMSDTQRVVILVETLQHGRIVMQRDWLELSEA